MILSAYEDYSYLREALRLGAKDYIRKTSITGPLLLEKVEALYDAWQSAVSNALAVLKGQYQELRLGGRMDCGQMRSLCRQFPDDRVLIPFISSIEKDMQRPLNHNMSVFDQLEKMYGTTYSEIIANAVVIIRKEFANPCFSNSSLATDVGMSERRLAERFKAETGHTINDYLTFTRMEEAKRLLRSGRMIYETAALTGYNTPQYFGVVFKNYTGVTPSDYQAGLGK